LRQKYSENSRGFTLLEIIITILIIAIVTAVGLPGIFRGMDSTKSQNILTEMVMFLRESRMDALSKSKTVTVTINLENGEFSSNAGRTFSIPDESDLNISVEDEYLYIEVEETSFTFFPNGMASGGELTISSEENKLARVFLDPLTGLANYSKEFESEY